MYKKLKNKKIKFIFGLILLITLNFTSFSFINKPFNKSTNNLNELKSSGVFYDIVIDDLPGSLTNWSWAATQLWFGGGSGTPGDPYIIENHTFEFSTGSGNSFSILNSRKDFIINNCTFKNSGGSDNGLFLSNATNGQITNNQMINNYRGIYLDLCNDTSISDNLVYGNTYYGILLVNSHFNTISENNASLNGYRGIRLYQSTFNTISENTVYDNGLWDGIQLYFGSNNNNVSGNTVFNSGDQGIEIISNSLSNIITGNTIINHGGEGIYISSGCNYNLLYENILKNNGLHAIDNGANNDWNNSYIGNYWDNYTGYDMDLDGIGDTPYTFIGGSAGSIDYLPIWNIQAPIAIDDLPSSLNNWTWAASQAWCSGSGTELDPYIIEDLIIDANLTDSCISILNSEAHFKIQGCILNNSVNSGTDAGIYLYNVTNGNIIGNNFYNHRNAAIRGTLSDHFIVSGNVLNNHTYGIYIDGSYNEILDNTIYGDGTGSGIAIQGSFTNNTINGNTIENCWQGIFILSADNNTILDNTALKNMEYGIVLTTSSNNNLLSGNKVLNNTKSGIIIYSSNNNTIEGTVANDNKLHGIYLQVSDDNTIYDNFIRDNIDTGVYIDASSDGNLIYSNLFWGNGRHAFDDGAFNDWNSTTIGNYWDNYTGYDMDLDGIGDTPYTFIGGSAGSIDYLPIWNIQAPIAIDDLPGSLNNWTWAASQPWFGGGSGTELDPYIIEGLNIDNGGIGNCLSIKNSIKHFIIQECTLTNSGLATADAGVYLSNVTNAVIIENNCSNTYNGIYLESSDFNDIIECEVYNISSKGIYLFDSNNNTISKNIVMYNFWGLFAEFSNENTFSKNAFNNNTQLGMAVENSYGNKILENTANFNTNMWGGIMISISVDTLVQNNTIIGNNPRGIGIIFSSDNNNATGNIIKENTLGIDVWSESDNNLMYENFFFKNGIHAVDDGSNNDWNSTTIGNYWDNHTGPDVSPIDGIVDNPYTYIGGSAGSIDYLPIAEDGPPSIIINSPSEDDVFGTSAPSFSVTITDNCLDETWYTLDGGLHNYTFTGSTGTIDQSAWDVMPDGMITLTIYASDYADNIGSAEVNIEKDTQVPTIIIISPHTGDTFGAGAPNFIVEISDENLDSMWYTLDGGLHNYTFTGSNGTIDQSAWNAMPDGMITLTFYASDYAGNIGSAEVNIEKDAQVPTIIIISPNTGDTFGAGAPNFIVEISDENLDSMWYSLDGGLTNFTFTTNGTINQAAWSALSEGSVTITFYANNTFGKLAFDSVNVEKALPAPGDNFIIIIIIISIVSGAAIITVVTVILLKKRKA